MPKGSQNNKIMITKALIPVFYQNFYCLAADCQDNCCQQDWRIQFDKKDYKRLCELDAPLELREQLDKLVVRLKPEQRKDDFYAEFDMISNNFKCPLQNAEGFCSLQLACGAAVLPRVCQIFPRRIDYTPVAKEYTLSVACEGVLQQLWDLPQGVEFVEEKLSPKEYKVAQLNSNNGLEQYFGEVRAMCIDVLQERTLPLTERLLVLGMALQQLMDMDWQKPNIEGWLWRTRSMLGNMAALPELIGQIPGNLEMFITQNLKVLNTLDTNNREWVKQIKQVLIVKQAETVTEKPGQPARHKITFEFSVERYQQLAAEFAAVYAGHEYFFENLVVAIVLNMFFPIVEDKEKLWFSYVKLCSIYSFMLFVAVLGCAEDKSRERLFHILVKASRDTLHDNQLLEAYPKEFFKHESSSLAHMAILLRYM